MIFSPAGAALWKALDSAEGWNHTSVYTLSHEPSGTNWWIGNGAFFLDGYGDTPRCLGLIERHIIWRRVARIGGSIVAARFKPSSMNSSGIK